MKMILKWGKWIGLSLLCLIVALSLGGAGYQFISTKVDEKKYPPIGQMVDIGGYRLHLVSKGEGGPTVVLDAGLGGGVLHWSLVQPEVAKFTRVVAIDRAGNGWSDESPMDRTSENIVTEMHAALHAASIQGPYVLVGHSFGGLNIRLFANKYPNEVAGVVLVDSSHEDALEKMKAMKIPEETVNERLMMFYTWLGLTRLDNYFEKKSIAMFGQETRNQMVAKGSTTKFIRTVLQEWKNLQESCDQLKLAGGFLGDKPLIVLSAGKFDTSTAYLTQEQIEKCVIATKELQKDLLNKSNNAKQIIVPESDHLIPCYAPQRIVDAIRDLLQATNHVRRTNDKEVENL